MVNAANLVNFGSGAGSAVGDVVYSAYPLTAPSYLPLNNDTASYLTSSYPALGAIYAPTTVAYSETTVSIPCMSVGATIPIFNFVFGNEVFLGWSSNGNIITSYDTVNWVTSAINTDYIQKATNTSANGGAEVAAIPSVNPWKGMAYGNGRFVAIRNAPVFQTGSGSSYSTSSVGATAVSVDNGQTWVQGTLPQQNSLRRTFWQSIGFGGGRFVASGQTDYDGTNFRMMLAYSTDGVEWTVPVAYVVPTIYNGALNQSNIAFGAGVYVALSLENATTNTNVWYTSGTYPLAWNVASNLPTGQKWKSVAYGAGVFVAVGSAFNDGNTSAAASSTNGVSWTARTLPASLDWTSVTYANGYFMAVASTFPATTDAVATSPDGINWTLRSVTSGNVRGGTVAGGNGKFIFERSYPVVASASVISLNTAASTFTLPVVPPMTGMIPYMKAS